MKEYDFSKGERGIFCCPRLKTVLCSILIFSLLFFTVSQVMAGSEAGKDLSDLMTEAKTLYGKGDFQHAAAIWERLADISDAEKDPDSYLEIATYLAVCYRSLGYYQKALAAYQRALPSVEKSGDRDRSTLFLTSLGDFYLSVGDIAKAVMYQEKALEQARISETPYILASVLNNTGNVLAANGEYEGSLAAYEQCLEQQTEQVSEEKLLLRLRTRVLINIVRVTFWAGDYENTSSALTYSLTEIEKIPDSQTKASDLFSLGLLIQAIREELDPGDAEMTNLFTGMAYQALKEGMRIAEKLGENRLLSYACGYMGGLYESETRYSDAAKLTLRAIFFAQQGNHPDILYLWQWQMGRLFKTQGDTEDAVNAYRHAVAALAPIRHAMLKGYRNQRDAFYETVKPVYLGLADLLLRQAEKLKPETGFPGSETSRMTAHHAMLREARDTMERLKTAELQDFFEDECIAALHAKNITPDRTPPGTAIIHPIVLPDRVVMLLTLPDGMRQVSVPVDAGQLHETVIQFREHLQTRTSNQFLYDAWTLYDCLIRPMSPILEQRNIDTLVIAPDGSLRLIPFAALHDREHFLIEKYAVGIIPSATLTEPKPFEWEDAEIFVGGLSQAVQEFSPLPNVPKEMKAVKEIMGGRVMFQDEDYTLGNLTRAFRDRAYTIVHLATHGMFGGGPEQTFLLTYDDKLTMNRLEQLIGLGRFREKQLELLTLSACQTALGDELAALGLAGVAVKAGARSTLATLWYVDDEATSVAIREFYQQLRNADVSKVKALQNAQKKLIGQLRYWHPAYWAPFLLIGSWL